MIIKNCRYLDWRSFAITEGNLLVEEGPDGGISFTDKCESGVLDAAGRLVTRSFACGHHHIYSALALGMRVNGIDTSNFYNILSTLWWRLDSCLDPEMIESSAEVTALALLKNGVTNVIDHHSSPSHIGGSLECIARALDRAGLRHVLCYEISGRDGEKAARQGLEESEDYLDSGRQALVGLHASFTVGDALMKKAADLCEKYESGVHIHVAEDKYDQEHCRETYGKRAVERLDEFGFLDMPKSILAHCLHLSDNERKILKNSKAWIVQNPDSNLNNNVGFFNGEGLGERVMYGTDGMHSNMLASAKSGYFSGTAGEAPSLQTVYDRFRAADEYLKTAGFAAGGANNLAIIDYSPPTPLTAENFLSHFIYGVSSACVYATIAGGKLLYCGGRYPGLNEEDILKRSGEQAERLWKKMRKTGAHQ